MVKAEFDKKMASFSSKLDLSLSKKLDLSAIFGA